MQKKKKETDPERIDNFKEEDDNFDQDDRNDRNDSNDSIVLNDISDSRGPKASDLKPLKSPAQKVAGCTFKVLNELAD